MELWELLSLWGGSYFEALNLKAGVNFFGWGHLHFFLLHPVWGGHGIRGFWANFSLGWDPSRSVRNCQSSCSLTLNFLRGGIRGGSKTGSLRGGIYKYNWIFLRGGIPPYKTGLFLMVRSLTGWVCILVYFFILRFCQCRRSLNKLCFSLKEAQQFAICIGCRIQGYLSGIFFRRGTNETF